jgi:uncharacterized protein YoxC
MPRAAFVSALLVALAFGAIHVYAQEGPKEVGGYLAFTKEEVAKVSALLESQDQMIKRQQKIIDGLKLHIGCI